MVLGFAGLILITALTSRLAMDKAFMALERNSMESSIKGARKLYENELQNKLKIAREWATDPALNAWLDAAGEKAWPEARLDHVLMDADASFVSIAAANGDLLNTRYYDLALGIPASVPEDFQAFLAGDSYLRIHYHVQSSAAGLVSLPEKTLLMVAVPILAADAESLVKGSLIVGWFWDRAEFVQTLEAEGIAVYHQSIEGPLAPDFREAYNAIGEGSPYVVRPFSIASTAAYTVLRNIYGRPAVLLRLARPRVGYVDAFEASAIVMLAGMLAGIVLIVLLSLALEITTLRRLRILVDEVNQITAMEHISSAQISVHGKDEIGQIAEGFRYVLSALGVNRYRWIRTEKQLQKVLATSPAGIIFVDRGSNRVKLANAAAMKMLGAERGEVIDKPLADLLHSVGGNGDLEDAIVAFLNEAEAVPAVMRRVSGDTVQVLLNGREVRIDRDRSLLLSFIAQPRAKVETQPAG